jgi:hypothetical protein
MDDPFFTPDETRAIEAALTSCSATERAAIWIWMREVRVAAHMVELVVAGDVAISGYVDDEPVWQLSDAGRARARALASEVS